LNFAEPLTATADVTRRMPDSAVARADASAAAVTSLRQEQRRLERLGLELPLARCAHQLRYWSFVNALCSLESGVRS
jgi:hypothetical protein